jgi:hypothetical protein
VETDWQPLTYSERKNLTGIKGMKRIGKGNLLIILLAVLVILAVGSSLLIDIGYLGIQSVMIRFLFLPAPVPYPGIEVKPEYSSATCTTIKEDDKIYNYDIALSQLELKNYYDGQMAKYCPGKWSWIDLIGYQGAYCELNNHQFFEVDLYPKTPQKVRVMQRQSIWTQVNDNHKVCGE